MEDATHCTCYSKIQVDKDDCHHIFLGKPKQASEEEYMPVNCKEIGLAIMHQHIQDAGGRLAKELAKWLRKGLKELEAGFLREIDRFQSNFMQTQELHYMQELSSERKYATLYSYTKSLPVNGAKNEAAMGELNKCLLEMLDKASDGLKKALNKFAAAAQYKPAFAAYNKDEVLILEGEPSEGEKNVISALKSADMSTKVKAVRISSRLAVGDRVASELASRLQVYPISVLYLAGQNISDANAEVLAQAVFSNKALSAFCVASDKISDTGAKAVAKAARNSRSLTMFYLHGLEISSFGARAVLEAVKGCPLSVFFLGGNRISYAGIAAVAEVVKGWQLSVFCLVSDKMLDAGAKDAAKAVKDCPLSVFYLGGHKISDSGATAVAETLSSGECASTLSALYLLGGCIFDSGVKKVADAVRGCPLLSEFYFGDRLISGETVEYILEGMAGFNAIRSVNICIGDIIGEHMDSCINRLQKRGVARQFKLRFQCGTWAAQDVCNEFADQWGEKLAEFRVVPSILGLFMEDVILGVPK